MVEAGHCPSRFLFVEKTMIETIGYRMPVSSVPRLELRVPGELVFRTGTDNHVVRNGSAWAPYFESSWVTNMSMVRLERDYQKIVDALEKAVLEKAVYPL